MKALELKVNNIVSIGINAKFEPIYGFIESINCEKAVVYYNNGRHVMTLQMINPMYLTQEWLLKFGAINQGITFDICGISIWYSTYEKCFQIRYCLIGSDIERKINIEYVHQLQNIIFEFTGIELTLES